jgi:hypothetical protein
LIKSDDGLPAGEITRWEWHGKGTGTPENFYQFSIKFCHTSLDALGSVFVDNYDGNTPLTVIEADPYEFDGGGTESWFGFDFAPTFDYNGTDNLIIEAWWHGHDGLGGVGTYFRIGTQHLGRTTYGNMGGGEPHHGYPDAGKEAMYLYYYRVTVNEGSAISSESLGGIKAAFR